MRQRRRFAAFTLVEMMITVALLALVIACIIPAFTFFSRSVIGLGNYSTMSSDSRSSLEMLARDIHAADTVLVATADRIRLELPVDAGGFLVDYRYDAARGAVFRTTTAPSGDVTSTEVLSDVDTFTLLYFNRLGNPLDYDHAPLLVETKSVQVNAKLLKKVLRTDTSDYIISARFLMRNH